MADQQAHTHDPADPVATGLVQLMTSMQALYNRHSRKTGLTAQQVQLLCTAARRKAGLGEIAEALHCDRSNVSRLLDRVTRRGLAFRASDTRDGRVSVLQLSPDGQATVDSFETDLGAIDPDCAIAGITRERPGGLLRRSGAAAGIRTALNPLFAPAAVERWRHGIQLLARTRARALPGQADLVREFCAPLAGDLACLTAGLRRDEWQRLNHLGVRANALVLTGHADTDQARTELLEFCAPLVERSRRESTLITGAVKVMDANGMPPGEVVDACTTIYGGFPSVLPTLSVIAFETLRRRDVMAACRQDPGVLSHVIWEHLRRNARFTFGLPGRCMRDTRVGRQLIPEGANVLPVIRAAHRDPSRDHDPGAFDLNRHHRAILAFGAGGHVCPGKALTLVFLGEAMRALVDLPRGGRHYA